MPTVDFWLDWTIAAPVDRLRRLLPGLAAAAGYQIEEQTTITTAPGWAMFLIRDPQIAEPVGTARAQDTAEGVAQMFVGPGSTRDTPALAALNRAALQIYLGLVARGLLAPPPPLETPDRPLLPTAE